jgi:cysteine desulfuration protein SufE
MITSESMVIIPAAIQQEHHRAMVEELLALSTAEERLSFLMERDSLHPPLSREELDPSRKVPGCLSGLWLTAYRKDGLCFFAAHSDSGLVRGVTSFLCDLYSSRTPEEIMQLGAIPADMLKLEGLLSMTRKRALYSTVAFITNTASQHVRAEATALTPAA